MLFSVCIPVYNTSKYLDECLRSVLNQTEKDYEIVLVDDGSTDGSGEICDRYAAQYPNIRVIHKENEGLMMTRRRGFQEARGDYFLCVDSDDKLWDSRALEKIRNMIEKTGCDLVIYNYIYSAGGGRPQRESKLLDCEDGRVFEGSEKTRLYEKLLTSNNMNNMWIKCPARHVVDLDVDYSQWKAQICRAEDLFQSYPMLTNAHKIAYMSDPLYYYRWTPDSISNKPKFRYTDSLRCIYQRENDYMQTWGVSAEIRDAAVRRQLTGFLTVVCKCYFSCKKNGTVKAWKEFASKLAEDSFFHEILSGCDRKKVRKYYRMLHGLICGKRLRVAIGVMEATEMISARKHRREKHV